jgi:hypothetical protein
VIYTAHLAFIITAVKSRLLRWKELVAGIGKVENIKVDIND